ncbi:hypothetical protein BpHYR1_038591 [Brachionus plicatilis]|uniref:Uncharacterized protein n=1 Tax=Brachionus plicatilis TaxID=10195 RepID=A0A3M7Q725_BRAPC|nr:hypothetical protein BpHYR1_038591 [Brachionus plicatilis]
MSRIFTRFKISGLVALMDNCPLTIILTLKKFFYFNFKLIMTLLSKPIELYNFKEGHSLVLKIVLNVENQ